MAGTSIQSPLWTDTKPPAPVTLPVIAFKQVNTPVQAQAREALGARKLVVAIA
jgi:hypothetical protein